VRFVIVGMNNPLSQRPEHALWTQPDGCSGHRLWQMATARTGVSQHDWLRMTDRRNLVVGEWDRELGRVAARAMIPDLLHRTTVLLGSEVASCFPSTGLICQWARPHGTPPRAAPPWIHIPHPSGQNRWYNDPANRACVEILLGDLVEMCREREAA
jgi:hypothetical protein